MEPLCPMARRSGQAVAGPPTGQELKRGLWIKTKGLSFPAAPCSPPPSLLSQPLARLSAPLPRPRRSSAPAYSSVMKRPLSRCRARDSDLVSPLSVS